MDQLETLVMMLIDACLMGTVSEEGQQTMEKRERVVVFPSAQMILISMGKIP
jgi:hypothetical protein|tara:strand:- start:168 stop:323 length:156 start_codon:yes stop_codon:yes gene_type:complete